MPSVRTVALLALAAVAALFGCARAPASPFAATCTAADPDAEPRGQQLLERAVFAHGGLERFRALEIVRVLADEDGAPAAEHLLDVHRARARVRLPRKPSLVRGPSDRGGLVEWIYDRGRVVRVVDGECDPHAPRGATEQAARAIRLDLERLALPFSLLADAALAVDASPSPDAPTLRVLPAAPGAQPIVLTLDPRTHRITAIARESGNETWDFYASLDAGLRFPTRITADRRLGAIRTGATRRTAQRIELVARDESLFAIPPGCPD